MLFFVYCRTQTCSSYFCNSITNCSTQTTCFGYSGTATCGSCAYQVHIPGGNSYCCGSSNCSCKPQCSNIFCNQVPGGLCASQNNCFTSGIGSSCSGCSSTYISNGVSYCCGGSSCLCSGPPLSTKLPLTVTPTTVIPSTVIPTTIIPTTSTPVIKQIKVCFWTTSPSCSGSNTCVSGIADGISCFSSGGLSLKVSYFADKVGVQALGYQNAGCSGTGISYINITPVDSCQLLGSFSFKISNSTIIIYSYILLIFIFLINC